MKKQIGSIWSYHDEGRAICIPTNIGWKSNGDAVMGAGLAYEAAQRHPDLPPRIGKYYRLNKTNSRVIYYGEENLFSFPTKPLNEEKPWQSWQGDSDIDLIKKSLAELVDLVGRLKKGKIYAPICIADIGVPAFGCGNGNLNPKMVIPLMESMLDDQFILFEKQ